MEKEALEPTWFGYELKKTGHELKPLHCYFKLEHRKVSMEGTNTDLEPPFLPFLLVLSRVLRSTTLHPKSITDLSLRLSSCHMEEQALSFYHDRRPILT